MLWKPNFILGTPKLFGVGSEGEIQLWKVAFGIVPVPKHFGILPGSTFRMNIATICQSHMVKKNLNFRNRIKSRLVTINQRKRSVAWHYKTIATRGKMLPSPAYHNGSIFFLWKSSYFYLKCLFCDNNSVGVRHIFIMISWENQVQISNFTQPFADSL